MELPDEVRIRPFPHEGYSRGFRTHCPMCRDELWVEARDGRDEPFAPAACPACKEDVRPMLNVVLSGPGMAHLRGRRLHLSDEPI